MSVTVYCGLKQYEFEVIYPHWRDALEKHFSQRYVQQTYIRLAAQHCSRNKYFFSFFPLHNSPCKPSLASFLQQHVCQLDEAIQWRNSFMVTQSYSGGKSQCFSQTKLTCVIYKVTVYLEFLLPLYLQKNNYISINISMLACIAQQSAKKNNKKPPMLTSCQLSQSSFSANIS